jgi:hypothetical protein
MSNRKKRTRSSRPNQQWRRNPRTGKLEKFEGKKANNQPSETKKQPKEQKPTEMELTPGETREEARKNFPAKGFIPVKPQPKFRPCVCEGVEIDLNNAAILEDLRKQERAYDPETETYSVLVINLRFRKKHARHMRHFREFLKNENIRFVEV